MSQPSVFFAGLEDVDLALIVMPSNVTFFDSLICGTSKIESG